MEDDDDATVDLAEYDVETRALIAELLTETEPE